MHSETRGTPNRGGPCSVSVAIDRFVANRAKLIVNRPEMGAIADDGHVRRLFLFSVAASVFSLTAAVVAPTVATADPAVHSRRVCAAIQPIGVAACHARVVTRADGVTPSATESYVTGLRPDQIQAAYGLTSAALSSGGGRTIAIVDAYDNPNVESDLAAYRAQFKLSACGSGDGCFRKVNQDGGSALPAGDVGWGQEIALDVEMASAVCPNCKILLVEATSASIVNLGKAVTTAVNMGAVAVSNSYGANEFSSERSYDSYYNHANAAITVSSGDNGYGVEFPAASPFVTAVGGTSLTAATNNRGFTEKAWSGAGSGCSRWEPKPSFQHDSGCSRRTVADVSAVADPATGVAVFDSYGSSGSNDWFVFGGTSVASPIIASVFALGGHSTAPGSVYASAGNASALFDTVGGANGRCKPSYLCTAVAGYDGPTGLGTPNGTGAF